MATKIKQGDAYALPIQIRLNGELIGAVSYTHLTLPTNSLV